MAAKLCPLLVGRKADDPLFLTKRKKRLHPDNFVKRVLKPILNKLGIEGGAHAFRHGNATMLDSIDAPMRVRQERLGHVDPTTTMGYTHLVGLDERRVAEQIGQILHATEPQTQKRPLEPNVQWS